MIGNRIKEVRKSKGLSQAKLSKLVGITRSTISCIETNTTITNVINALKIAQALKVRVEDIFFINYVQHDIHAKEIQEEKNENNSTRGKNW